MYVLKICLYYIYDFRPTKKINVTKCLSIIVITVAGSDGGENRATVIFFKIEIEHQAPMFQVSPLREPGVPQCCSAAIKIGVTLVSK